MQNLKPLDYLLLETIQNNPELLRSQLLLSQNGARCVDDRLNDLLKNKLIAPHHGDKFYTLTGKGQHVLTDYQHQQKLEQDRLAKEEANKWYDRIWNSVLTLLGIITEFIKSLFIFVLFYQSFINSIIR